MAKQIYYNTIRENLKAMSPRFKQLAVQAGATQDAGTVICSSMDNSVFARLIVEECIQTLVNHGYTDAATALEQELIND